MKNTLGPVRQVAWLVEDLDGAMAHWMSDCGVGPWTCYRNVTLLGHYRGQATTITMDVGLSYQDGLQIELIRPRSSTPSPYQDARGAVLTGMHHMAWCTRDLDADVAAARARGLEIVFEAGNGASRVAYAASAAQPGLLLEFIEVTPELLAGFEQGIETARRWNGVPAVQTFDFAGAPA